MGGGHSGTLRGFGWGKRGRAGAATRLPAAAGRAGRKRGRGREEGGRGAAIKPAPAKPFPAAGGEGRKEGEREGEKRASPAPARSYLAAAARGGLGVSISAGRPGCPPGRHYFSSRLQRRGESAGAHIGDGKKGKEPGRGVGRGGRQRRSRSHTPSAATPPTSPGRPRHAAAMGHSAGTGPGASAALPRFCLHGWSRRERREKRAEVSVPGAEPPPPVPC